MARTRYKYHPLGGGLDLVSPPVTVEPGKALVLVNFEPWYNGGYRRVRGYERFDGRPRPSDAGLTGFDVSSTAGLSVGDAVTGDTSGATGVVAGIDASNSILGVTKVSGTFQKSETCNSGAFTVESTPVSRYAADVDTEFAWLLAAQDEYRGDIQPPAGSGEVRGAWRRGAAVYAFRNNAGGTAGVAYKASSSGWDSSLVTMVDTLFFDTGGGGTGAALPAEGDTVTGGTSGATATVHRVIQHTGSTGTNDAEGYLALTSVSGTFSAGEDLEVSSTKRAQAVAENSTFELPTGGHYQFVNWNFFAGSGTYRTYAVSGVGPAFEIDENDVATPVLLPNTAQDSQPSTNQPILLEVHRNALFLVFSGGVFQSSVVGEPLNYNGFLGAAEYGVGDEITGIDSVVGNVLVIRTERSVRGLYGDPATISTGSLDLELRLIGDKAGGRRYTSQKIDTVYALDDLGVNSLDQTERFGDFITSVVSTAIQPLVQSKLQKANCATVVRSSSQYRIYFDDSTAIVMYVPPSPDMPIEFGTLLYPLEVKRIWNSEDENGVERTLFVSDDGYVYEDRTGASFDGESIESYARLQFNNIGSPATRKRFRRLDLELNASQQFSVRVASDLTYGSQAARTLQDVEADAPGGFYDIDNWDEFVWDGKAVSTIRADLTGSGTNIGFLIYNKSAVVEPFVLQGVIIHYDNRRLQR